MTGGTTPEFPADMRKMIEQSVEQVRTAVTRYLEFLQRVPPGDVTGGSKLRPLISDVEATMDSPWCLNLLLRPPSVLPSSQ